MKNKKQLGFKVFSLLTVFALIIPVTHATAAPKKFKLCAGLGGIPGLVGLLGPTTDGIAKAGAKARGWDYYERNNKLDAATTMKNADLFIQQKCSAILFFAGPTDALAAKFAAAKIPVITYDLPRKGWYFLGIDNSQAGYEGGKALGNILKTQWNCQPDLVLNSHGYAVGIVDAMRSGGMSDGIKAVCPDIDPKKFKDFEGSGSIEVSSPAARDILAANPTAKKIAAVGLNDAGVVGVIQAARQLGSDYKVLGWGQDGNLITGDKVDPDLKGSVLYFLEGYSSYAFSLLDEIAAGKKPAMRDAATNPAVLVKPCPVTAAQAATLPLAEARAVAGAGKPKSNLYDMYCPKK